MADNAEHDPAEKPAEQEQSASRRALIRAGWAIPVVLAATTPANVFAAASNHGKGKGHNHGSAPVVGDPFKKTSGPVNGAPLASAQPQFSLLDREVSKITSK